MPGEINEVKDVVMEKKVSDYYPLTGGKSELLYLMFHVNHKTHCVLISADYGDLLIKTALEDVSEQLYYQYNIRINGLGPGFSYEASFIGDFYAFALYSSEQLKKLPTFGMTVLNVTAPNLDTIERLKNKSLGFSNVVEIEPSLIPPDSNIPTIQHESVESSNLNLSVVKSNSFIQSLQTTDFSHFEEDKGTTLAENAVELLELNLSPITLSPEILPKPSTTGFPNQNLEEPISFNTPPAAFIQTPEPTPPPITNPTRMEITNQQLPIKTETTSIPLSQANPPFNPLGTASSSHTPQVKKEIPSKPGTQSSLKSQNNTPIFSLSTFFKTLFSTPKQTTSPESLNTSQISPKKIEDPFIEYQWLREKTLEELYSNAGKKLVYLRLVYRSPQKIQKNKKILFIPVHREYSNNAFIYKELIDAIIESLKTLYSKEYNFDNYDRTIVTCSEIKPTDGVILSLPAPKPLPDENNSQPKNEKREVKYPIQSNQQSLVDNKTSVTIEVKTTEIVIKEVDKMLATQNEQTIKQIIKEPIPQSIEERKPSSLNSKNQEQDASNLKQSNPQSLTDTQTPVALQIKTVYVVIDEKEAKKIREAQGEQAIVLTLRKFDGQVNHSYNTTFEALCETLLAICKAADEGCYVMLAPDNQTKLSYFCKQRLPLSMMTKFNENFSGISGATREQLKNDFSFLTHFNILEAYLKACQQDMSVSGQEINFFHTSSTDPRDRIFAENLIKEIAQNKKRSDLIPAPSSENITRATSTSISGNKSMQFNLSYEKQPEANPQYTRSNQRIFQFDEEIGKGNDRPKERQITTDIALKSSKMT